MDHNNTFHYGELHLQKEYGVEASADKLANRMIRENLSEQQQNFFPLLNTLFIASIDNQGRPWASMVTGQPGFVHAAGNNYLHIDAQPLIGDPLRENLIGNYNLGILAIEFETRRRNRVAGKLISLTNRGLKIQVSQALGNCPKYIQARKANLNNKVISPNKINEVIKINMLTTEAIDIIVNADTFFIASYCPDDNKPGADISHRGGKPGFVSVEDNKYIVFDDYAGNNLFMTLGNMHCNPAAGLLFINYENGDLLQLTCKAEIVNSIHQENARTIKLQLKFGWIIKSALNIQWEFIDYSPFL